MPRSTFLTFRIGRDFAYWLAVAAGFAIVVALAIPRISGTAPTVGDGASDPPNFAQIGQSAPDFFLTSLEGESVQLSSFAGRPVVLYFWASWCHYCAEEMPKLVQAVQEAQESSDIVLLSINMMESAEKAREALDAWGVSTPVLLDRDALVAQKYLVNALPNYYFIDGDGVLRGRIIGAARPGALQTRLHEITRTPPGAPSLTPPRLI